MRKICSRTPLVYSASPDLLAKFRGGKERKVGKGMGETWVDRRRGRDGGGKEGDQHPPHVRSPPTVQPRLRL